MFKRIENPRQCLGRDADSGIDDLSAELLRLRITRPERDPAVQGSELHGVAEKIPKHLLNSCRIAVDVMTIRTEIKFDVRLQGRAIAVNDRARLLDQLMDVDDAAMQLHFAIGDAREIEQIVDQLRLELHVSPDHGDIGANFRWKIWIRLHRTRGHQHGIQRRAKFMAQDREEAIFGGVSALGCDECMP